MRKHVVHEPLQVGVLVAVGSVFVTGRSGRGPWDSGVGRIRRTIGVVVDRRGGAGVRHDTLLLGSVSVGKMSRCVRVPLFSSCGGGEAMW